jgi:hypothetical protein
MFVLLDLKFLVFPVRLCFSLLPSSTPVVPVLLWIFFAAPDLGSVAGLLIFSVWFFSFLTSQETRPDFALYRSQIWFSCACSVRSLLTASCRWIQLPLKVFVPSGVFPAPWAWAPGLSFSFLCSRDPVRSGSPSMILLPRQVFSLCSRGVFWYRFCPWSRSFLPRVRRHRR